MEEENKQLQEKIEYQKQEREKEDKRYRDNCAKASNPNTKEDELRKLSASMYPEIQVRVINNPKCPVDVLDRLSTSRHNEVLVAIAKNPKSSSDVLRRLANSGIKDVKSVAASNPNFKVDELIKLSDKDKDLSSSAEALASSKKTSVEVLNSFLEGKDIRLRLLALDSLIEKAKSPQATPEELTVLAQSKILNVKVAAINNSLCPLDVVLSSQGKLASAFLDKNTKNRIDEAKKVSNSKFKEIKENKKIANEVNIEPTSLDIDLEEEGLTL